MLSWLALGCLGVVVPVSTALVWMDPAAPRSLSGRLTAVWRTSAETLRLGVATGAPPRMLLSVLLGLIALLCVSTLVGVITTGLGDRLAELRRGRSTVLEREHAVVLGWSEQVFTVVAELVAVQNGRGRGVVAVLADRDSAEMDAALAATPGTGLGRRRSGRARLVCRSGTLTDPAALALVAPAVAGSVLVLPAEGAQADLEVVRILLALGSLIGAAAGPPVVAAVRDGRYLPAARLAAGPRGVVLETDMTTARLLVQSARRPGLSAVLRDLLDVAGAEFHVVEGERLAGSTFGEVAVRWEAACAVGLLRADGRPLLTPGPQTPLEPGDRFIVVAHDDTAPPTDCRTPTAPPEPPGNCRATPAQPPGPEAPVRVLLLGWNRRAPLIVDILRRTVRPDSVLDVVTGPDEELPPAPPEPRSLAGRLAVSYHVGDLARPETLPAFDLSGYDSVIVLGADADADAGCARPDDRTLLALLMLRAWEEETGHALPVVAELHDHRSRALAPLGPASDAVVRGELTALLMAQICRNPTLAPVFEEVFAARGGALGLCPADRYVAPGRAASFATVVAAALRHGECAIGYRAHTPHSARRQEGIRLCPGKSEHRVWAAEDEVVVVLPAPAVPAPADDTREGLPRMRQDDTGMRRNTGMRQDTKGSDPCGGDPPELR
ncbi:TrkA C-terminal domain-containing protein [Streptomyces sp. NPDC040750]|uniref:CASTOR/POLLUX-related putative ion channel n=1 Tax=Streptomyces sp. NPDC040750 TaxID=3154491 RepID=UPI0033EBB214